MPFINGKYYMNPSYGLALERARLRSAGAEHDEPEVVSASDASDGHWVTIDHRHVLIHEPLPSSGFASIYSDWFEGKKTSSGEIFHQSGYTAALLPRSRWNAVRLGTKVEITSNGRSVVVEIEEPAIRIRNRPARSIYRARRLPR